MNLPQLPTDKANHALYGALIFSIALIVIQSPIFAMVAVLIAAIGKEISDAALNWRATGNPMHGPHGVEIFDAVATAAGGVLAALPLIITHFLSKI